jgi:hypothetical protein
MTSRSTAGQPSQLDANEPEQLLTQSTYRATIVRERKLRGELFLDSAEVIVGEPGRDNLLLVHELTDLLVELFRFEESIQRKASSHV